MQRVSQERRRGAIPGTLDCLYVLSLGGFSENRDDWRERTESRDIKFLRGPLRDLPFF